MDKLWISPFSVHFAVISGYGLLNRPGPALAPTKYICVQQIQQLAVPNMNPQSISIKDYSYTLPESQIALQPLPERDASRLLMYKNGIMEETQYRYIDRYLPADSLLVFNNTKVVAARLIFQKPSGGSIEIFCLEPTDQYPDISTGMLQQGQVNWKCLIGGAAKWKAGQILQKTISAQNNNIVLEARFVEKQIDCFIIALKWMPAHYSFAEILQAAGLVPLPPYIKRNAESADKERYQTIYANPEGSVAAPTAGLHFTNTVFENLSRKNIQQAFVTLHVGAGTFKPVKAATMQDHPMHAEFMDISTETILQLSGYSYQNIIAVGTTSLRTMESLYWMGVKTILEPTIKFEQLPLEQWEVYSLMQSKQYTTAAALKSLLQWMEAHHLTRLICKTSILIVPGYRFKMIGGLVTNFHQPESTLLLLVAAMLGKDWERLYAYALSQQFRFLSYGDGCLLFVKKSDDA